MAHDFEASFWHSPSRKLRSSPFMPCDQQFEVLGTLRWVRHTAHALSLNTRRRSNDEEDENTEQRERPHPGFQPLSLFQSLS